MVRGISASVEPSVTLAQDKQALYEKQAEGDKLANFIIDQCEPGTLEEFLALRGTGLSAEEAIAELGLNFEDFEEPDVSEPALDTEDKQADTGRTTRARSASVPSKKSAGKKKATPQAQVEESSPRVQPPAPTTGSELGLFGPSESTFSFNQAPAQDSGPSLSPSIGLAIGSPARYPIGAAHISGPPAPPLLTRNKTIADPLGHVGYNPNGVVGSFFKMPATSVIEKVAAPIYVPLWHFTTEGIAEGYHHMSNWTEVGKRLANVLQSEVELPPIKIPDEFMGFETFFQAADYQVKVLREIAKGEIDPLKQMMLSEEAAIWTAAYNECLKRRLANKSRLGAHHALHLLPPLSVLLDTGGPGSDQPFSVATGHLGHVQQPQHLAFQYQSQPFAQQQQQPVQQQQQQQAQGQGSSSRKKAAKQQQPFQSGSRGGTQAAPGACVICGKTTIPHNFKECNSPPTGKSAPFASRNEAGHLVRISDGAALCMRWNRTSCGNQRCFPHQCSICGATNHGAQQCSLVGATVPGQSA
ncbi:hypothetical protein A4X06_0g5923 [Tilletia controversa]|uniref:Uncharacterized protein n=1 Tax=Tilletia controversa TaxID=13291 RepID=A0A8X7SVT5_9BASI|nr:hypothetical protein A4X06_0g5923 [Tilletia controversa]